MSGALAAAGASFIRNPGGLKSDRRRVRLRGAGKPPVGDTRRLLGTDPTFRPLTLRSNRWSPPTCCKDARRARRPDGDVLGADSSARGRPPPAPQPNSWASQPFWGSLVTAPEVVNGATSPTSSLGGTSPAVSSGGGGGGGGGGAPPAPPSHGGAALGGLAHGKLESFWSGGGDATCCGSDAAVGPGICWMMACNTCQRRLWPATKVTPHLQLSHCGLREYINLPLCPISQPPLHRVQHPLRLPCLHPGSR